MRWWARSIVGVSVMLLLVAGALQAWPGQVDDVYISLVYSQELAEHGRLAWSDGRVVEGFSNPLWVAIGAAFAATPWDPSWLLQALSLLLGLAVVLRLVPRSAVLRDAPVLAAVPLLVAASEPVGWWSGNGMETMLYSLLLVLGWTRTLGHRDAPAGLVLLLLAALTRTEGHLHLAAAAALTLFHTRRPGRVLPVLLALGAFHTLRIWWFGEILPLPTMVKALDGAGIAPGLHQLGTDLLPWTGVLLLAGLHADRHRLLGLIPLGIQALVLTRAGGDWMGHGRLLLPGVLATLALWRDVGAPRPLRAPVLAALAIAGGLPLVLSPTGDPTALKLRNPVAPLSGLPSSRLDLDTTLQADLQFSIPRLPPGATVYATDIGMLGHVDDLVVRDMIGLTDRDVARSRALGDPDALARTLARMDGSPDSALCLRMVSWGGEQAPPLPAEQDAAYPHTYSLRDPWSAINWHCRTELAADRRLAARRWEALADRFPAHPWLRWNQALALADQGDLSTARTLVEELKGPGRWHPWGDDVDAALTFVRSDGPLRILTDGWFEVRPGGLIVSRPLSEVERNSLILESRPEDEASVSVLAEGCAGIRQRTHSPQTPVAALMDCAAPGETARLVVQPEQQLLRVRLRAVPD